MRGRVRLVQASNRCLLTLELAGAGHTALWSQVSVTLSGAKLPTLKIHTRGKESFVGNKSIIMR